MKVNKLSAIFGVFGSLFVFILITVVSPFWPGYNYISEYVSVLGSASSPFRYVVNILGFVMFGLIIGFFANALREKLEKNILVEIATGLLRIVSVLLILMGLFPVDRFDSMITLTGEFHHVFTILAFIILPASMICFAIAFRKDPKWGRVWSTISFGLVLVASIAAVWIIFDSNSEFVGSIERIGMGSALLWIFLVSVNLFTKYQLEEIFPNKIE